jgi:hypothetical protein
MKPFISPWLSATEAPASDVLSKAWQLCLINLRIFRNGLRILDFERLIFLNECAMLRRRMSISFKMFRQRRQSGMDFMMQGLVVPKADYHFKLLGRIHNRFWPDDPIYAGSNELRELDPTN